MICLSPETLGSPGFQTRLKLLTWSAAVTSKERADGVAGEGEAVWLAGGVILRLQDKIGGLELSAAAGVDTGVVEV